MALNYDVVIATRNRGHALSLSIPLMLSQSTPPARLIVADSSDDHSAIRSLVSTVAKKYGTEIIILECPRGLTRQRNIGLASVHAEITMFPDDDALWFPETAAAILRIYERDRHHVIGAVCAAESPRPPIQLAASTTAYQMSAVERLKQKSAHKRATIERRLFPDPFVLHGMSRWEVQPTPDWLVSENAVLVEWMTGFRMSFRTDLIREYGFDEILSDYGLFEDADASFQIMQRHLVVGARNAQVYHHKAPGRRGAGDVLGFTQIINRAYVICKHAEPQSPARMHLRRYARYKISQYALGLHTKFGRERLHGARLAMKALDEILAASPKALAETYTRVCASFEKLQLDSRL